MFVLLGYDGKDLPYVRDEARNKNERYRTIKNSWFNKISGDPDLLSPEDTKRITFRGHGSFTTFGGSRFEENNGFTPQQFVEMLKKRKMNKDFPDTIETLDLIGCEIGLKKENKKSWVESVSELIAKEPQLSHIKTINAVIYDDKNNEYDGLIVYAGKNAVLMNDAHYKRYCEVHKERTVTEDEIDQLKLVIAQKNQECIAYEKNIQYIYECKNERDTLDLTVIKTSDSINNLRRTISNQLDEYKATGDNKDIKEELKSSLLSNNFINSLTYDMKYNSGGGKSSIKVPPKLAEIIAKYKDLQALQRLKNEKSLELNNLDRKLASFGSSDNQLNNIANVKQSIIEKQKEIDVLIDKYRAFNKEMQIITDRSTQVGNRQDPRSFVDILPCLERKEGGTFLNNSRGYILPHSNVQADIDKTERLISEENVYAAHMKQLNHLSSDYLHYHSQHTPDWKNIEHVGLIKKDPNKVDNEDTNTVVPQPVKVEKQNLSKNDDKSPEVTPPTPRRTF